MKSASQDRRTVPRPPASESVSSCGIQHGPITSGGVGTNEHASPESHLAGVAMCSLGREEGGVGLIAARLCPSTATASNSSSWTGSSPDKHTQTRTTNAYNTERGFLTQAPALPPAHEPRNLSQISSSVRAAGLVLLTSCASVASVTSLSGWLWPFPSACGRVPLRRCRR